MANNPSKKIRLDFQTVSDGNAGNEDLWGQDDLTAEEFDFLEIQATQSCNQNTGFQNHAHMSNISAQQQNFNEVNDSKQLQYELEGRVKLLSQSLERSIKELSEERLNRECIINNRIKEYNARENTLLKDVEKMRSILEFKDQEMKSTYSKLQVMKSHLLGKKNTSAELSVSKNFEDFLKGSKSDPWEESSLKTSKSFCRRYKLPLDTPKGETKGIDVLSSLLCTRLDIGNLWSFENMVNCAQLESSSRNSNSTSISIIQLKNEQKCDELLEYYTNFLENHVVYLKTLASKGNLVSSKSSPIAIKRKDIDPCTVISFLSDIAYLLSCPVFNPLNKKYIRKNECAQTSTKEDLQNEVAGNLFSDHLSCNEDRGNSSVYYLRQILETLLALTDPKTYPAEYSKKEEIEFSLSALLSLCLSDPERFMVLGFELPIHSFLNPHQSVTALCTTLKLLAALCCCKSFASYLIHKNDNCLLCLIATLLVSVVPCYPQKFSTPVILVEDFLSSVFSVHNISEIGLETSCISEIIQGIIKCVWKYYQLKEKNNLRIQIIQKGFLLLHTMSSCIPNFKERRSSVEEEYISLITSILSASKNDTEFKEFYDLVHSLWDFQTDTTEFELDDITEETQALTNEADVVE